MSVSNAEWFAQMSASIDALDAPKPEPLVREPLGWYASTMRVAPVKNGAQDAPIFRHRMIPVLDPMCQARKCAHGQTYDATSGRMRAACPPVDFRKACGPYDCKEKCPLPNVEKHYASREGTRSKGTQTSLPPAGTRKPTRPRQYSGANVDISGRNQGRPHVNYINAYTPPE